VSIVFEVKNLVADYGAKTIIRNLSFKLPHPAFVAIVGHNGSGKTTLFKALSGQLPYRGEILINNQQLNDSGNPFASGLIALLAQKNNVGFSIPVEELVVMGRFRLKKFFQSYNEADYTAARQALELLRLWPIARHNFINLSGGEQQLVWLAQLMVQDTPAYLLDEPTQQLDLYNKKQVFTLMMQWVKQYQKTVLCITHDLHNLYAMEGYILNLSVSEPLLEPLHPEVIRRHITALESER
jgi:iron complex transport system ATP-binding protein